MSERIKKRFFDLLNRVSSQTEKSQILKIEVFRFGRPVDSRQSEFVFFQDEVSQRSEGVVVST